MYKIEVHTSISVEEYEYANYKFEGGYLIVSVESNTKHYVFPLSNIVKIITRT